MDEREIKVYVIVKTTQINYLALIVKKKNISIFLIGFIKRSANINTKSPSFGLKIANPFISSRMSKKRYDYKLKSNFHV